MCSMWPLSLEERLLSGMAPCDSGGLVVPSSGREYTMEIDQNPYRLEIVLLLKVFFHRNTNTRNHLV